MKKYFQNLGADLPASIVVFLVALPLCLGIALASNAPLFSGIIGGIIGGIIIGGISGSQLSVSGPAAGLAPILAGILGAATNPMPFSSFLMAVVLCGVFQLAFGFLRAGIVGDYVPNSVIKGMLAAIGLLLIFKQFPHLIGYDKDFMGDEAFEQKNKENTFTSIINSIRYNTPGAVLLGSFSLAFLVLWEKITGGAKGFIKLLPASLLVVLGSALANQWFISNGSSLAITEPEHIVSLPVAGSAKEFFGFFTFPDFAAAGNPLVWKMAITIALVASLETLLSIEAVDKLDVLRRVTPNNLELKAQGVGNLISGLIGGLPLTSVIVRSSANVNAGARTKLSAVLHGILLLICVAFIPRLINLIPNAALAAILIYTGYKLVKPSLFKTFYQKGWDQFIPFVVTIVAILLTDLLVGVLIGIGVGLFYVIRSNFRTAVFVVNHENKYLLRLRKEVSFLNKPVIKQKLEAIPENAFLLIDAARADFIDQDVVEEINNFMTHAHLKNISVEVKASQHKTISNLFNQQTEKISI